MIMKVFSPIWCIEAAFIPILVIVITKLLHKKSIEEKTKFMKYLIVFSMIIFAAYKTFLVLDPDYDTTVWEELPFNLCNLCIFFGLPALSKRFGFIKPFLFYWGILGAVMGMVFASSGFVNIPFWYPRCIGYFFTHILGMVIVLLFVTLGIYHPTKKDILIALAEMAVISFLVHLINILFRETGIAQTNFFYTYGIEGNVVYDFMLKIIPIPYLFYVIAAFPVILVDYGLYGLTRIGKKKES